MKTSEKQSSINNNKNVLLVSKQTLMKDEYSTAVNFESPVIKKSRERRMEKGRLE